MSFEQGAHDSDRFGARGLWIGLAGAFVDEGQVSVMQRGVEVERGDFPGFAGVGADDRQWHTVGWIAAGLALLPV